MEINERPLVTLALFSYNQEAYVQDAIKGAFSQTYSPLEIILSDDCSSDKTFEIMCEEARTYNGPHLIRLNKNEANLGLIDHVNKIFEISAGEIIVAAAGDDISLPDRTSIIVKEFFCCDFNVLLMHSKAIEIDLSGNLTGRILPSLDPLRQKSLHEVALASSLYLGGTGAWSKELYKKYGPLQYVNAYEDLTLGFRAYIEKGVKFIDSPLVKYRTGGGITTSGGGGYLKYFHGRKKYLKLMAAVLQQRRDDYMLAGQQCHDIQDKINKELKAIIAALAIYQSPNSIPKRLVISPFAMGAIFIYEAKVILKIIIGRISS